MIVVSFLIAGETRRLRGRSLLLLGRSTIDDPLVPIARNIIASCLEDPDSRIRVTFALPLPQQQIAERQQDYSAVLDWSDYPPARQSQSNRAEHIRQFRLPLVVLLRNGHPRGWVNWLE